MDSDFRGGIRARRAVYRRPSIIVRERRIYTQSACSNINSDKAMDIIRTRSRPAVTFCSPTTNMASKQSRSVRKGECASVTEGAVRSINDIPGVVTSSGLSVKRTWLVIWGVGAIVLLTGTLLTLQALSANRAVEQQLTKFQQQATDSTAVTSMPTDVKPKDPDYIDNYPVAPQLPKIISIPKIGIRARIVQVGVDIEGRLDVPRTAYDVGWYTGSSRPGEQGAMVIDGHVQGVGGGAIFTNLNKLLIGDKVDITRGDGKQFNYTVVATETVPVEKVNMAKLLISQDPAKSALNLITCGGSYNASSGQFSDRTIIYTLQTF